MSDYPGSFEDAARELASEIEKSVMAAVEGEQRVAVAFSGGLDSSILAACCRSHADTVAVCASIEGSKDRTRASKSAKALGIELVDVVLTEDLVRGALARMKLPFEASPMDKGLWSLYYVVAKEAAISGTRVIILGQLADELFGGYEKYQVALDAEGESRASQMMQDDLRAYPERGRLRDVGACSPWAQPKLPFEAEQIVALAASLPLGYKVRSGVRKAVLRRAAVILGVPEEIAETPKKAAQYSSGILKLVT